MPQNFVPPHGGYEDLLVFQKARIVYGGTVRFWERLLDRCDQTVGQMAQAARFGKNILGGSQASGTSKEAEIKLINVARASLEELLEDYRDFLRVRKLPLWDKSERLEIERKFLRIFDALLYGDEKRDRFFPVDSPVIVAQREIHHWADNDLVFDRDRPL